MKKTSNVVMKVKVMPESPETDLESIKQEIKEKADVHEIVEQPVAFGLVALIVTIVWPEDTDPDLLEDALMKIEGVSSIEVLDVRRLL
jgi:elongation factor 1-beta